MIAAFLWVAPSGGSQGKGTLGDRFVHADNAFFRGTPDGEQKLVKADHEVMDAIATF